MDEKNCITKSTDDCQRVLRMQSEKTGQHWVQDFSSLAFCLWKQNLCHKPNFPCVTASRLWPLSTEVVDAHMQTLPCLCPETYCYTSDWLYPDPYLPKASFQSRASGHDGMFWTCTQQATTNHRCLLSTWNVTTTTDRLGFSFLLINIHLNSHAWLLATVLGKWHSKDTAFALRTLTNLTTTCWIVVSWTM